MTASGLPLLVAQDIMVRRGARAVVRDLSLTVSPGELVALVGPNGAGKSTLLSTLCGDRVPDAGTVRLGDPILHRLPPAERARRRAVLPQQAALSFDLPVLDVVQMGRTPFGDSPARSAVIAREALAAVELEPMAGRGYLQLSGGERQRVQFARFLAQTWPDAESATVGLLDEPVANLDPRQQHRSLAVLRSLASTGRALVVVLHDLALASLYADRVVVLRDGQVLADAAPDCGLTCDVLESAFDTRFSERHGDGGRPVLLPCARQDALQCAACSRGRERVGAAGPL